MLAGGTSVSGPEGPLGSPSRAARDASARTNAIAGGANQGGAGVDRPVTIGHQCQWVRVLPLTHQRDETADMRSGEGTAVDEEPAAAGLGGRHVAAWGNISVAAPR